MTTMDKSKKRGLRVNERNDGIRFRDCLIDGWHLYRENASLIIFFCAVIFIVTELLQGLNGLVEVMLGDAFLTFCGTLMLTAKSLLLIQKQDDSLSAAIKLIQPKLNHLLLVWLIMYLLMIIDSYLQEVLFTNNAEYTYDVFVYNDDYRSSELSAFVLSLLRQLLFPVCLYFSCVIIHNYNHVVKEAFQIVKRTLGKTLLLLIFNTLLSRLVIIVDVLIGTRGFTSPILTGTLIPAIEFFFVTTITVIYCQDKYSMSAYYEEIDDIEEEED